MANDNLLSETDLIPAEKFCTYYHVEFSFIRTMHESGLIKVLDGDGLFIQDLGMVMIEETIGAVFLQSTDLPELEKYVRWHYDLSINPEGIEVISRLLHQIDELREENRSVRNRLRRYESGEAHAFREADL